MNSYTGHSFRDYKPPRRNFIFLAYMLLFGVILGIVLTNSFRPFGKNVQKESEQMIMEQTTSGRQISSEPMESQSPSVITPSILTDYEYAVVAAVQKAKPAVVSIYSSSTQYFRFRNPIWDRLYGLQSQEFRSMGSGVIIEADGTVITNEHVISIVNGIDEAEIMVVLSDGRKFEASIVKVLLEHDLAILSIDGNDLPYIEIGSSANLLQGQTVLAIGNPFGISAGSEPTVTRGIISSTKRNLTSDEGNQYFHNMIQTDASINEGNSGGPLIDLNGRMIGINTAIWSQGAGSIGIGFAIPSDHVKLILDNFKEYGDIGDIVIGMQVQPLTEAIVSLINFTGEGGVIISNVESDSPAENAGFLKGDIITNINGSNVFSVEQSQNMFKGAIPGEVYGLRVFRSGEFIDFDLKLGLKEL